MIHLKFDPIFTIFNVLQVFKSTQLLARIMFVFGHWLRFYLSVKHMYNGQGPKMFFCINSFVKAKALIQIVKMDKKQQVDQNVHLLKKEHTASCMT